MHTVLNSNQAAIHAHCLRTATRSSCFADLTREVAITLCFAGFVLIINSALCLIAVFQHKPLLLKLVSLVSQKISVQLRACIAFHCMSLLGGLQFIAIAFLLLQIQTVVCLCVMAGEVRTARYHLYL